MYTTYHLNSAEELTPDIMESIKLAFKSRPIKIIVEESEVMDLTDEQMAILDERLTEDTDKYVPASEVMAKIKEKYGL